MGELRDRADRAAARARDHRETVAALREQTRRLCADVAKLVSGTDEVCVRHGVARKR